MHLSKRSKRDWNDFDSSELSKQCSRGNSRLDFLFVRHVFSSWHTHFDHILDHRIYAIHHHHSKSGDMFLKQNPHWNVLCSTSGQMKRSRNSYSNHSSQISGPRVHRPWPSTSDDIRFIYRLMMTRTSTTTDFHAPDLTLTFPCHRKVTKPKLCTIISRHFIHNA